MVWREVVFQITKKMKKRKSKKKPEFKILRAGVVMYRCDNRKKAISWFKTLVIINQDPTTVVNSHGTKIYDRHMYEKESPELFKVFPNFKIDGVFS